MHAIHFLPAALFVVIAALQFNDPDPLYWVTVYAATAGVALARAFGRFSLTATAIVIGAVLAGMLVSVPALIEFLLAGDFASLRDMQAASYVEPAREFGGLLLALALLVYYARR